jgi:folate-binding protein YgfZ
MLETKTQNVLATLRERGGYFHASNYGLIEVYGPDTARFLQSQTTNDVNSLSACCGQPTCLLDRKAHVLAAFDLYRRHKSFRIIVETSQIERILAHFDEYRFADKVEFLDLTNTGEFFAVQGPEAPHAIAAAEREKSKECCEHDVTDTVLWDMPVHVFRKSVTGELGYFIWISRSHTKEFTEAAEKKCTEFGFAELDEPSLETARIEAGLLKFGVDFDQEFLLPETGTEETVASFTKGCFLGQEVLARVKSQGSPSRAIVGVLFGDDFKSQVPIDSKIISEGKEVGWIKSNTYSSQLNKFIGYALVKRDWRVAGKKFDAEVAGVKTDLTVTMLPFQKAETAQERAKRLYDKALALYPKESETETESESVALLRQVLRLNPKYEDAYETLGVILSKRDHLDEAIKLMEQLALINPDSVMAHTNLSVFYVQKGDKDKAEEEKAISMSIRMQLAAREATVTKKKEEESKQNRQAVLDRMNMFKQVLGIDAEDLLANYGYGSCLVELQEFQNAVPYLQKAIAVKPMHTVAYVALAKAYEGLSNKKEMTSILEQGIEVASKKGDLVPLKEMQTMLASAATG